MLFNDKHPKL